MKKVGKYALVVAIVAGFIAYAYFLPFCGIKVLLEMAAQ